MTTSSTSARRGADDEARPCRPRLVAAREQQADELERLAETHLVGEDAAESEIHESIVVCIYDFPVVKKYPPVEDFVGKAWLCV